MATAVENIPQSGWIESVEKARSIVRRFFLIAIPVFVLYNIYFPWPALKERSLFVILFLAAAFLDARKHRGSVRWLVFDTINLALTVVVFGYVFLNWRGITNRLGMPDTMDLVLGVFAVYLVLLATWRLVGRGLFVVVVILGAYVFLGQYLPYAAGGHSGYSISRIFTFMLIGENGVMGFAIGVLLKSIIVFLMLGQLLIKCGALNFIMDLAMCVFGRRSSGFPLTAVFSSALVGTVVGSGTANVMITGNVTIPGMKRMGIKPELAGAVEAAASTGGQIMPPVMGAAVFFMIALLGIPYFDVVKVAFVPAILYFLAVGVAVYFRTRGVHPSAKEQTWTGPSLRLRDVIFRVSTVSFVGTLGILVFLLAIHYSLQLSALYAMSFGFISSFFGRDRLTPRRAVETLEETGQATVGLSGACLAIGLITGGVLLTGLGGKIPRLLIAWSGGHLVPTLFFTTIAAMILGMGVPTSVAYLVVAVTASGAIIQLGVPVLSAHLFVFYMAMSAMITPPVALSSYAAATIARANFWKTGILAFILGLPCYLVPFAWIFRPGLLLWGSPLVIISDILLAMVGLTSFVGAISVSTKPDLVSVLRRVALAVGGLLMLLFPTGIYTVGGAILCLVGGYKVYMPWAARMIQGKRMKVSGMEKSDGKAN